jgi:Na+-transporting NADH:ubiquinone oxidoreductase subunit C
VHSNKYTFLYAIIISVITAVLLAFASEGLRPRQEANIELDKKTSILRAVNISSTERDTIEKIYASNIREVVVNSSGEELKDVHATDVTLKDEMAKPANERKLPLYVYTDLGGQKRYIIPMQGVGLWGPIWGWVSLEDDFNTVYGAFFSHKSETPGLGAEIAEPAFQQQFHGKKIMSEDNSFISVRVVKKAAKVPFGPEHRVDGVSGGTITSNGTDAMLLNAIEPYLGYFQKLKSQN